MFNIIKFPTVVLNTQNSWGTPMESFKQIYPNFLECYFHTICPKRVPDSGLSPDMPGISIPSL